MKPLVTARKGRVSIPLLALAVVVLAGGGGYFWYQQEKQRQWRWDPIPMPETMARVPNPWNVRELATRLKSSRKIHDAEAFEEAATEVGLREVKPGGYLLPATAGPRELARVFAAGPTHLKVTFPEGFTAIQISERLKARDFKGAGELQSLAYPAGQISPLEGRLFPDTYLLPLSSTGKQLAGRLQERFVQVSDKLPRPFPTVDGKPLTLSQVIILASLVEREAASAQEMPEVAGVILNRLNKGMRLQVDATVQYARVLAAQEGIPGEGHKAVLKFSDLKIDSPYNTYKNAGLPPAPICNPGTAALMAAARPRRSDYLFYVMSPLLKRHRFGKTFADHQHNIRLAKAEHATLTKSEAKS